MNTTLKIIFASIFGALVGLLFSIWSYSVNAKSECESNGGVLVYRTCIKTDAVIGSKA